MLALALVACVHPTFDLQGHRGARGDRPENTLLAFEHALSVGVTTLELDVGITEDGIIVVHHDERLNPDIARIDQAWVKPPLPALRDITYAVLTRYDVGRIDPKSVYAKRFVDQVASDFVTIPRLSDVIDMAEARSDSSIRYNIETKLSPDGPTLEPDVFADALINVIRDSGIEKRSTVQSFDWRTLAHVRGHAPRVDTACLTAELPDLDTLGRRQPGPSRWTAGYDIDDYNSVPAMVADFGCPIWSPSFHNIDPLQLTVAKQLGLRVIPWTVNEPADIDVVLRLGVDGIISDYPARVRSAMERLGMPLPRAYQQPP